MWWISVAFVAWSVGCGGDAAKPQHPTGGANAPATLDASLSQPASCVDFRTAKSASGEKVDCYPLRCRDGACLTKCATSADCAGATGPATLAEEGWPLRCQRGECVPLPPGEVPDR